MVEIKTENLTFAYPNGKTVLKNINLEIQSGEFVLLCGRSGEGKTTLLRLLKPQLSPNGALSGKIKLFGKDINELSQFDSAAKIGFILQNPEYQLVTHSVRSELAFGLENLGMSSEQIRLAVAETASYFSLSSLTDKKISELSGGQKQLVCLASVFAMHPQVLILDEPTSQLDPIAAENLLKTLLKLCKENGVTVIMTEHRLENVIAYADRLIFLENGEIVFNAPPSEITGTVLLKNEFLKSAVPSSVRIHAELGLSGNAPLTVAEGRRMLDNLFEKKEVDSKISDIKEPLQAETALELKDVWYSYDKTKYVLKGLNLKVKKGSFFALMGENSAGKTTALNLASGVFKSKRGKVKLFGKKPEAYSSYELYHGLTATLPQKCELLFAGPTVKEDLENVLSGEKLSKSQTEEKIKEVASFCEITSLLGSHPYDISCGELQRAALAAVLLKEPKILFLDEPTKGMDNLFKEQFAKKIKALCQNGTTVVMVSHDAEFCAKYCDECALIFDGVCAAQKSSDEFFSQNYFYTTAAHKIARQIFPSAVTESQVIELCKKNLQS